MTNPRDIAERIEAARAADSRSVAWVSEQTGIAEKTYRRRIAAPENFTLGELVSITSALRMDLEHVLTSEMAVA